MSGERNYSTETMRALAAPHRNGLAGRGGVKFRGSSNSKALGILVSQTGLTRLSIAGFVRVPDAVLSSQLGIFGVGGNGTDQFSDDSFGFYWGASGGILRLSLYDNSAGNSKILDIPNVVNSETFGKWIHIMASTDGTTTTVYINGKARAGATSGSLASWSLAVALLPSTMYVWVGFQNANNVLIGDVSDVSVFNFNLNSLDAEELHEAGGSIPQRLQWASQVWSYTSDFSAGTGGWSTDNNVLTGNVDTAADGAGVPPTDNWLKVATDATETLYTYHGGFDVGGRQGSWIRFTADIFVPAGSPIGYVNVTNAYGGTYPAGTFPVFATTPGTAQTITGFFKIPHDLYNLSNPRMSIGACNSVGGLPTFVSGTALYVKNVSYGIAGCIGHWPMNEGIGYQLHDLSSNKFDMVLSVGSNVNNGPTHLIPQRRGYVRTPGAGLSWTASSGFQSALGQRAFPDGVVMTLLTAKSSASTSGTGTRIGTTNDNARWSALAAMTANTKVVRTIANSGLPNGTAHSDTDFGIQPDSVNFTGVIQAEAHYVQTEG